MSKAGGYYDLPFLAELYDYTSRARPEDVEFYASVARGARHVLELGCGTGRVLIPLAEKGLRMTGLDVSPHMLGRCRRKVEALPAAVQARVTLAEGDMAGFRIPDGRFDCVLVPFRAFQHLQTLDEQMGCLGSVSEHLESGGRLVIDVFQPDFAYLFDPKVAEEREDVPETVLPDGRAVRRTSRLAAVHRAAQLNEVELIFYVRYPDGGDERLVQAFPMRYFFRYEVEHLLARCGFALETVYGDFDGSPLSDASPEMIFVARRG